MTRAERQAEIVAGCGICGGPMVSIRPHVPKGERRVVCPTCLADRMDLIRETSDPEYGMACASDLAAAPLTPTPPRSQRRGGE